MKAIETVESADLKKALPKLNPGDTVRVHVRVKETNVKEEIKGKPKETERERVQVFEGVVIGQGQHLHPVCMGARHQCRRR